MRSILRLNRGYIRVIFGVISGLYCGYIGVMGKKMESSILIEHTSF